MKNVGWVVLEFGRLWLCGRVVGGRVEGAQASGSLGVRIWRWLSGLAL